MHVHSEGDQPWDFFGRNDAKAETSSTLATSCEELTHWERLWCWEGLGAGGEGDNEDEMAGWHHWLDGCEFEWIPGDGDGQGGLACCDSWGHKELETTEWLNWTELKGVLPEFNIFQSCFESLPVLCVSSAIWPLRNSWSCRWVILFIGNIETEFQQPDSVLLNA